MPPVLTLVLVLHASADVTLAEQGLPASCGDVPASDLDRGRSDDRAWNRLDRASPPGGRGEATHAPTVRWDAFDGGTVRVLTGTLAALRAGGHDHGVAACAPSDQSSTTLALPAGDVYVLADAVVDGRIGPSGEDSFGQPYPPAPGDCP